MSIRGPGRCNTDPIGAQELQNEVMTVDEVAQYLRLGRRVVYRLAQQGDLPGRKIANRWRFHLREVEAWVRNGPANDTGDGAPDDPGNSDSWNNRKQA